MNNYGSKSVGRHELEFIKCYETLRHCNNSVMYNVSKKMDLRTVLKCYIPFQNS